MTRRAAPLAVLLVLLAAVLGGCGDGGGNGETDAEPLGSTQGQQPQIVVQAAGGGFDAAKVYREASPGVVTIRSLFGRNGGEGSGFVLDTAGHIVTNAHVVTEGEGSDRAEASAVFVEFSDRNVVPAEIVGFDPFSDVALLEVDVEEFELQPLTLGDDEKLVVGQPVAAIGSPFGEQQSLSVGVVSATDRSVRSLTEFQIEGAIQTDASINPGNSGGPLLDAAARVIGINQQIETSSGADDGVGFAVPISAVRRSIAQLRRDGEVEYAYIGVSTQALYPQLARRLDLDTEFGALIAEVVEGGPADRAGLDGGDGQLRFQGVPYQTGGDTILAIDGRKIVRPDDLGAIVASRQPGDRVTLQVLHSDGDRDEVEVTLGKRPVASVSG